MTKRRVFISYHHAGEQYAVDRFVREFSYAYDVFTDKSLERAAKSTDVDYLARVCREAIDGTSVTIVMVGPQTGCRKFVDWEIRYTLERQHGLIAIGRPGISLSEACLPPRFSDNWFRAPEGQRYASWREYPYSPNDLRTWIEAAVAAPAWTIKNGRVRMPRNCTCSNGQPTEW